MHLELLFRHLPHQITDIMDLLEKDENKKGTMGLPREGKWKLVREKRLRIIV